ncbi:MAG: NAD(P)/FAD-dependent oxidoreductase [Burkholderiales bacterium]
MTRFATRRELPVFKVDLLVVGASFAGLACARAAARTGLSVLVLEKKRSAGAKLHTTGIIVKDAVDTVPWLADVPTELVRRIEGVRLYAPNMRHVDLHAPGYYFLATDAPALLDWMVDSVRACQAMVRLDTLFDGARWAGSHWIVPLGDGTRVQAAYIVGADGPHSQVAKALGLSRNRHFLYGVEHEYRQAQLAPGLLHCFVDRQLAPGYIGWAFEGVGVSQIGLARRVRKPPAAALRLDPLLEKIAPFVRTDGTPPLAVRAGMIPCGGVLPIVARERALLVGDAAGMVSPVTAGGSTPRCCTASVPAKRWRRSCAASATTRSAGSFASTRAIASSARCAGVSTASRATGSSTDCSAPRRCGAPPSWCTFTARRPCLQRWARR